MESSCSPDEDVPHGPLHATTSIDIDENWYYPQKEQWKIKFDELMFPNHQDTPLIDSRDIDVNSINQTLDRNNIILIMMTALIQLPMKSSFEEIIIPKDFVGVNSTPFTILSTVMGQLLNGCKGMAKECAPLKKYLMQLLMGMKQLDISELQAHIIM